MVKGLDVFCRYFRNYTNQYVLIGGAACDISFRENDADFRMTKDLDIVLIVEAQTKEFGQMFWKFIEDGKYMNKARSNGKPQFYRFDKPQEPGYPAMLELFARSEWILDGESVFTPVHIDDSVSSLSAILLDDAYYEALLLGRDVIDGVSVLRPEWLVPFKAKAWLDLNEKQTQGIHVDTRDIKKHKNDIIRIVSEFVLKPCAVPKRVREDLCDFTNRLHITVDELKNLKINGMQEADIKRVLRDTYHL